MYQLDATSALGFRVKDEIQDSEARAFTTNLYRDQNDILCNTEAIRNTKFTFTGALITLNTRNFLFKYIWGKACPTQADTYFNINGTTINYSGTNHSDAQILQTVGIYLNDPPTQHHTREKQYSMDIYLVTRGVAVFDIFKDLIPEAQRCKNIERAMCKTQYHRTVCIQDGPTRCVYITNKFAPEDLNKLFGMLPLMFKDLLPEPVDTESEVYQLFEAVFNNNVEPIITILKKDMENINVIKQQQTIENFKVQLMKKATQSTSLLTNMISDQEDKVRSAYNHVREIEDGLQMLRKQLLAASLSPPEIDEDAIKFLSRSKHISILNCDTHSVAWRIETPLVNYIKKDVEMYFKRPERNILNSPDWFADLIKKTFLEEKYEIQTITHLHMEWANVTRWSVEQDTTGRIGNPHMTNYNCFPSTKNEIKKAVDKGDILQMCNLLIAACATLTFTDSTVVNRFAQNLQGRATEKVFKNTETGELISTKDYKEIFNEKNNTNNS